MKTIIPLISLLACADYVSLAEAATPMKIMPLGDSLTSGYSVPTYLSGYRDRLYSKLVGVGYNPDFIGTQVDTHNPAMPDLNHEGHGGYRIDQIDSGISGWLSAVADPDVILLLIGTNDFTQDKNPTGAPDRLSNLISKISSLRSNAKIVLGNLPLRTDSTSLEEDQNTYNEALPGIVNDHFSLGQHVYFVDMHSSFSASGLSSDGVHPNSIGYDAMADVWTQAIVQIIPPPSAPTTILTNGSFELGTLIFATPFPRYQLNNWTSTGAPFGFPGNSVTTATDGLRMALFNGGSDIFTDTLSQTFETTPGVTYRLDFDYGIVVGANKAPRQQLLGVTVTGEGGGPLVSQDVPLTGNEGTAQWTAKSYLFTATTATTTLVFTDKSGTLAAGVANFSDLLLDNVRVNVAPPNAAPVADDDLYSTAWATALVVASPGVLVGDTDVDSPTLTAVLVAGPSNGNLILNSNGSFSYAPINGFSGTDSFSYKVNDGFLDSNTATVSIVVNPTGVFANGSFELGALISSTPFPQYQLNNWTATGAPFGFLGNSVTTSTDGLRMALFNGASDTFTDTLTQTFATTPGMTYQLNFDYGIVVAAGKAPRQQLLGVTVTGEYGDALLSQDIPLTGNSEGAQWTPRSYFFTATTAATTMIFTDKSGTLAADVAKFSDLLLDNVRLNTAPTITDITDKSTKEDTATSAISFTIGDLETTASDLSIISVSSNPILVPPTNVVLGGSGADRSVSITPAANQSGSATITLTVSDGTMTASDTFVLTVTPVTDNYFEWLAELEITGNPGDDLDHDSITNAVEYVIGGNPEDHSDLDLLPSISLVSEIPNPYFITGNYLLFSYRRTHLANNDPSTTIKAEWNESLTGPWTTADGSHGEVIVEVPNGVENGIDKVNVYIPCPLSGRLFGRLGVAIDAP